ncbi:MAG: uracil-DNA glycosylase [Candidatus Muiribacteriota bacterium]
MDIIFDKDKDYNDFIKNIKKCTLCPLCEKRTNVVTGDGNINSKIMIVGEGPGEDEDIKGIPFVGKAGQLLDKILNSVGFDRKENIYITNVVKCRPPQNRDPEKEEIKTCSAYLLFQIELIKPEIIITLGNHALNFFVENSSGITKMRGKIYSWNNIKIIPMYHPSYLLRNMDTPKYEILRKETWYDINLVKNNISS